MGYQINVTSLWSYLKYIHGLTEKRLLWCAFLWNSFLAYDEQYIHIHIITICIVFVGMCIFGCANNCKSLLFHRKYITITTWASPYTYETGTNINVKQYRSEWLYYVNNIFLACSYSLIMGLQMVGWIAKKIKYIKK